MLKDNKSILKLIDNNYWTNWLGLSRSILALSLLLTLLLNNTTTLFYTGLQNEKFANFESLNINIYSWFGNFEISQIVSIIILFFVLIGIFPKYTCIPHWIVVYSYSITSTCADGGDQVASIVTLLLIPICIFDKRKWHWSSTTYKPKIFIKIFSSFFYYLLQIQIFTIYFFASVGKFKVEEWLNGTAIYYWLKHPLFGVNTFFESIINFILEYPILTALLNWSVLFLELIIAFSFLSSSLSYRKKILVLGFVFHLSIMFLMGIATFSLTMTAILILFLISKNNNYAYRNINLNFIIGYINNISFFPAKKNQ